MTRLVVVGICVLAVSASSLRGQSLADFSGRWERVAATGSTAEMAETLLVREVEAVAEGPPGRRLRLPVLRVERHLGDTVRTDTWQVGIEGGFVGGVSPRLPGEQRPRTSSQTRYSVRWDDHRLVAFDGAYTTTGDRESYRERTETWELDPSSALLVTVVAGETGQPPVTSTQTYRKRP
jgi:hypothetical protein